MSVHNRVVRILYTFPEGFKLHYTEHLFSYQ